MTSTTIRSGSIVSVKVSVKSEKGFLTVMWYFTPNTAEGWGWLGETFYF